MIRVIYDGGLGNWLFQYCFGRLLAERLGYALTANSIPGIAGTFDLVAGEDHSTLPPRVLRGQKPDLAFLGDPAARHHLVLTGYFQRWEYYLPERERIRKWLYIPDHIPEDVTARDVVVSIRRGQDYIPRYGLPISYYESALRLLDFDRVFICTNEPTDPFVTHLARKYGAAIRAGSFRGGRILPDYVSGAIDNFVFIRKFRQIVLSNSSFPWWAAFLSDATRIIGPRPASGMWAPTDPVSRNIDLEVPEARYTFISCEPYTTPFLRERLQNAFESIRDRTKARIRKAIPFLRSRPVQPAPLSFQEETPSP